MIKKTVCLLLSALFIISVCACSSAAADLDVPVLLTPEGIAEDTAIAEFRDLELIETYECSVVPTMTPVSFSASGKIADISAYSGKWVEEGEKLAEFDTATIEEDISFMKSKISAISKEGDYDQKMYDLELKYLEIELTEIAETEGPDSKAYSEKLLEIDEANLKKSQSAESCSLSKKQYSSSLKTLESLSVDASLYAPHEGYVYCTDAFQRGATIGENQVICYITDLTSLYLDASSNIPDRVLENASFSASIDGKIYKVTYQEMSSEEKSTYTLAGNTPPIRFSFSGVSPEYGHTGILTAVTAKYSNVLTIPTGVKKIDTGGTYVYVKNGEQREKRYITIGHTDGAWDEVKTGLEEGDVIYVQD